MLNPFKAVGLIVRADAPNSPLGTTFAFRQRDVFLTAAHCVDGLEAGNLRVAVFPEGEKTLLTVSRVERHVEGDIAVLNAQSSQNSLTPFWNFVGNYSWGEEFFAFGYPEDIFGPVPGYTARLFKGHFQRTFPHRSHRGYQYIAAELSIQAPAGLSGGPLFRPAAPTMLTGLVTEDLESTSVLDSEMHIETNGAIVTERFQQIVNYGIALLLDDVGLWLNDLVPKYVHPR